MIWAILPLHLCDVTFPASHPLAGSDGAIYGFAVRSAAGVVLFETGVGFGHAWIDDQGRESAVEDPQGPPSRFLADFFVDGADSLLLPGTTSATVVLFAVAADAQTLTLGADPGACAE